MNVWQVGNVTIKRVVEIETEAAAEAMSFVIPEITTEAVLRELDWLNPQLASGKGWLKSSLHALAIDSCGQKIIVDPCTGNHKNRPWPSMNQLNTPFLSDLTKAGFPRESVSLVLCSHLHPDHVGWNTMLVEGRWVPTFPNARYLIGRREWEYWDVFEHAELSPAIDDSVRPVIEAGLVDLVETDHQLTDEIVLESTPGHTPGHVSVRISSSGAEAVISGDLMHHPIQCAHPQWLCVYDSDPEQGRRTRIAFIERYVNTPTLVFGTHFPSPSAGRIVENKGAVRFEVSTHKW